MGYLCAINNSLSNDNTNTDMKRFVYILILLGGLLSGCSRQRHDPILERIDRLANINPDSAKRLLDSIDPKTLKSPDRYYRDFLSVKVNDKIYVPHVSDSLIMGFVNYAKRNESPATIDEAYYYAGRVYNDLNDYPNALRYYQKALDNLPSDSLNSLLHCKILIHAGRVLDAMRLNREAVKYYSEMNRIAEKRHDTVSLIHNLHSMRLAYMRMHSLDTARMCASRALELCPDGNVHLTTKSKMLLAEVFYKMGRNDTALKLVRHAPELVNRISRNAALSIAADIYERANITDTTWMYARNLIESDEVLNKHNGYRLIFSTPLYQELPGDSLMAHLLRYHDILEDFYNRNDAEQAILQHTVYNYEQHERARAAAERANYKKRVWITILSVALTILFFLLFLFYEKQKRRKLELDVALSEIKRLESALHPQPPAQQSREELISTLRKNFEKGLSTPLHDLIAGSAEYQELKRRIDGNLLMSDDDQYWSNMEQMISEAFPKLKNTLADLATDKLSPLDWHVAIMIKCKIPQANMARILGIGRSAVTHRLYTFSKKIFGSEATPQMLTGSILLIS